MCFSMTVNLCIESKKWCARGVEVDSCIDLVKFRHFCSTQSYNKTHTVIIILMRPFLGETNSTRDGSLRPNTALTAIASSV